MLISTLLIFIAKFIVIFAEFNLCPKQMYKHSIFDLKKITKFGGGYHSLHKIYLFPKFIVSFSISSRKPVNQSE